jgi:hypothetical protein
MGREIDDFVARGKERRKRGSGLSVQNLQSSKNMK